MANKTITMLQVRRILQLLQEGKSKRQIARDLSISRNTFDEYQDKYNLSSQSFSELLSLSNHALWEVLHPPERIKNEKNPRYEMLLEKIPSMITALKKPGVTRQLLWQEYNAAYPEGYSYGHFCQHMVDYMQKNRATMHFEHKPGEFLQIDFAGALMNYINRDTGEIINCPVLVCVLPYSGEMCVESLPKATSEYLFAALGRCMAFLGEASPGTYSVIIFDKW